MGVTRLTNPSYYWEFLLEENISKTVDEMKKAGFIDTLKIQFVAAGILFVIVVLSTLIGSVSYGMISVVTGEKPVAFVGGVAASVMGGIISAVGVLAYLIIGYIVVLIAAGISHLVAKILGAKKAPYKGLVYLMVRIGLISTLLMIFDIIPLVGGIISRLLGVLLGLYVTFYIAPKILERFYSLSYLRALVSWLSPWIIFGVLTLCLVVALIAVGVSGALAAFGPILQNLS